MHPRLIDRAIREIDRLRESGPGLEHVTTSNGIRLMPPPTPPPRFCRSSSGSPPNGWPRSSGGGRASSSIETDREDQLQTSYIGYECTLLRGMTAKSRRVFEPMDSYLKLGRAAGSAVSLTPPSWPRAASTPGPQWHSSNR